MVPLVVLNMGRKRKPFGTCGAGDESSWADGLALLSDSWAHPMKPVIVKIIKPGQNNLTSIAYSPFWQAQLAKESPGKGANIAPSIA
jgi:hypothetical protein